jgi:hypothetical protein
MGGLFWGRALSFFICVSFKLTRDLRPSLDRHSFSSVQRNLVNECSIFKLYLLNFSSEGGSFDLNEYKVRGAS